MKPILIRTPRLRSKYRALPSEKEEEEEGHLLGRDLASLAGIGDECQLPRWVDVGTPPCWKRKPITSSNIVLIPTAVGCDPRGSQARVHLQHSGDALAEQDRSRHWTQTSKSQRSSRMKYALSATRRLRRQYTNFIRKSLKNTQSNTHPKIALVLFIGCSRSSLWMF